MNLENMVLLPTLVLAAEMDSRTGLLKNWLTGGSCMFGLAIAVLQHQLPVALLGMLFTGLPLLILTLLTHGRGLGMGDAKFAAAIGAALGPTGGLSAVMLAFIFGACICGTALAMRILQPRRAIAFGPFLALGAACVTAFPRIAEMLI